MWMQVGELLTDRMLEGLVLQASGRRCQLVQMMQGLCWQPVHQSILHARLQ